jgi:hypothetical protein
MSLKVRKKCRYYAENQLVTYTPACTGDSNDVHPESIEGDFCQFCGRKIKFMDGVTPPQY